MSRATMTTKEVAKYLDTSSEEVLRLHNEGLLARLPGFQSPFKFSKYHIEDYLKKEIKLKE
jgi:hypothetical protein